MRKLTADDFKGWAHHNGVDLVESEWGADYYAYGHIDKDQFAQAVNEYNTATAGLGEDDYIDGRSVHHIYGITTDDSDEWQFDVSLFEDEGTFPVTRVIL